MGLADPVTVFLGKTTTHILCSGSFISDLDFQAAGSNARGPTILSLT